MLCLGYRQLHHTEEGHMATPHPGGPLTLTSSCAHPLSSASFHPECSQSVASSVPGNTTKQNAKHVSKDFQIVETGRKQGLIYPLLRQRSLEVHSCRKHSMICCTGKAWTFTSCTTPVLREAHRKRFKAFSGGSSSPTRTYRIRKACQESKIGHWTQKVHLSASTNRFVKPQTSAVG